ncbi:hypothetical protein PT2222_150142 [Paraburkholderia tropica]
MFRQSGAHPLIDIIKKNAVDAREGVQKNCKWRSGLTGLLTTRSHVCFRLQHWRRDSDAVLSLPFIRMANQFLT